MDFFSTALDVLFIPALIFIVFTVHEYGHYIMARFFNISVDSFSLGYGRDVAKGVDKHGTAWVVKMIPLCGHVQLSAKKAKKGCVLFSKAPIWQRVIVVAAGPAVNIILAFFVIFFFLAAFGQPSQQPVIAGVERGAAAEAAGMEVGDRILSIEGKAVQRYRDVWDYTWNRPEQTLALTVQRGDALVDLDLTPSRHNYTDLDGIERSHGRMGVMIGESFYRLGILETFNDEVVPDDFDARRKLLVDSLGQQVSIGVKSTDGTVRIYNTVLDRTLNEALLDPDSPAYNSFYAGPVRDNFYLSLTVTRSLIEAGKQVGDLVKNIATIPFQIFPVDSTRVKPWAVVNAENTFWINKLYIFAFRLALLSIFIAMFNMIPFPGLDGSMLLMLAFEAMFRDDPEYRHKIYKYVLILLLGFSYFCVFIYNLPDFPRYVEKRVMTVIQRDK